MQIEQSHRVSPPGLIIVRLLNGILKGCEYRLAAGKTLFISADEDVLDAHALPSFPEDSILIPTEGDGVNFEIVVPEAADEPVILRDMETAADHEGVIAANVPITVGPLIFALRNVDEDWSAEILAFQNEQVTAPIPVRTVKRKLWRIVAVAALAVAIISVLLLMAKGDYQQREIVALSNQLSGESGKFNILSGRNGALYALASDERDAAWGRQSLVRSKPAQPVVIATFNEEIQRVDRWLRLKYPTLKMLQFRLAQPAEPVLVLSRQRSKLSESAMLTLQKELLEHIPYAQQVRFEYLDDSAVANDAEEGVKKLAVRYTRRDNADSVTFIITGALDDGERQRIRLFVEDFLQRWNGHYIQFAVELKEDWLKGKSFKYGPQGYIKMTPGHWYFQQP
jgi:type III secretion system PrgH/EprH family protein